MQLKNLWRLAAFLAVLNLFAPAHAAVGFDACAASDGFVSSGTTVSASMTVGAGANRALVAFATFSAAPTSPTAVWDSGGANQTVAQIGTITGSGLVAQLYGLVNPSSTTANLTISWTGNVQAIITVCAWTNVDQTGGATSFPGVQTGTAATTVTVTSAAGDVVVGAEVIGSSVTATTGTALPGMPDNARSTIAMGAQREAGAATVATGASSGTMSAVIGVNIKASGGAASVPTRALLGVGQ